MLGTDSGEYDQLDRAVEAILDLDANALTCEIGLRAGGGTKRILDALNKSGQTARTHIAIDPYGNIEYLTSEGHATRHDYTNYMRNTCFAELFTYLRDELHNSINVLVFNLEDSEFFERYADGVPIYDEYKRLATKYALVHFDGPHALAPLRAEVAFFTPRLEVGAQVVFDDISNYPHDVEFEPELLAAGFKLEEKGSRKARYVYQP